MEETSRKAQRMVGLGPLDRSDLDEQCNKEPDFEKVKMNLIEKHLKHVTTSSMMRSFSILKSKKRKLH